VSEYFCVSRGRVDAKRSWDIPPVGVDWFELLANKRTPGLGVNSGFTFRPPRPFSTGLQYRCCTAGVTSGKPFAQLRWPTTIAGTIADGTAVWTAEAISSASLLSTISSSDWPAVDGLTLTGAANNDLQYQINAAGGVSGQIYEIAHRITLANGNRWEWIIELPVQD
jgi:hypothetical protein